MDCPRDLIYAWGSHFPNTSLEVPTHTILDLMHRLAVNLKYIQQ